MTESTENPVVGRHVAVFTKPPKRVPSVYGVDGPLLGNGDVGVVISGEAEEQTFWIGKIDFWSKVLYIPLPPGAVTISIPALADASYRQEQDLQRAEVRGRFEKENIRVTTRSWTPATNNLLVTELSNEGSRSLDVIVDLWTNQSRLKEYPVGLMPLERRRVLEYREAREYPTAAGTDGDLLWVTRHAEPRDVKGMDAAMATRIAGVNAEVDTDGVAKSTAAFLLAPGRTVQIVTAVVTDRDVEPGDPLEVAKYQTLEGDAVGLDWLNRAHQAWWSDFWSASFLELADKKVESFWYGAQYIMACCNRAGKLAPGLWGNWITTDRSRWNGDYTLNYNFQCSYFGIFAANHPELAIPYYDAVLDFVPRARKMAREHCCRGVHFPTHIGPYGLCDPRTYGQRSNASYCAVIFEDGYNYTLDEKIWREKLYPFLIEVANFWEDYLEQDAGRYVVYRSNAHESENWGRDTNALQHRGFLRRLFQTLLDASADLDTDAERREKWSDIVENFSDYTYVEFNGVTVFSLTENEPHFKKGGASLNAIFPGAQVDEESEERVRQIALDSIEQADAWEGNGFCRSFPAAVRMNYPGILEKLRQTLDELMPPNLYVRGGGGIETCGASLAVSEMLLQSHRGYLRFFPVWPRDQPARFGTLRARNAFLVSAELNEGVVENVEVLSEKGRDCTIVNPWPGKFPRVTEADDGKSVHTVAGASDKFTFSTRAGGRYRLDPG